MTTPLQALEERRIAIFGAGAIATGIAVTAASAGADVVVIARSRRSADRIDATVAKAAEKAASGALSGSVRTLIDADPPPDREFVIEAIAENGEAKETLLGRLGHSVGSTALLASTTSSLSIENLALASGCAQRFFGLHVFNPVHRMKLVELIFPTSATEATRERARALCIGMGKQPVEVPDTPGFVVNRLLFPYLFDAVRLLDESGLEPAELDRCMTLGAAHPMGPLALLDFVGLDVAAAIGESLGLDVPRTMRQRIAAGALGAKTDGQGLLTFADGA